MKELVTPRQVAQAINVSESSLKRWCDQGLIAAVRTAGGHRRIPVNSVLTFLRESGYELVHPEILGLPPATQGGQNRKLVQQRPRLIESLVEGNEDVCVEVILNLYLARIPFSLIFDELLAPAFAEIGEKKTSGDVAIYKERRSCELCQRLLYEVRRALPELSPNAPIAVGGTLDGDPDSLSSTMAELVLRENGWRACSLGTMLPFLSLRQAVCDMRPRLLWLQVSVIHDFDLFLHEFDKLAHLADENDVAIVIGGKAFNNEILQQLKYSYCCESYRQLETFAKRLTVEKSLIPSPPPKQPDKNLPTADAE